jgi:uncharacterized membrane protein
MYAAEVSNFSLWWLFPLVMIVLCFLMMRGRKGSMMCGFGSRDEDSYRTKISGSAKDILDKRSASGDINKEECEEIKRTLTESTGFLNDCE